MPRQHEGSAHERSERLSALIEGMVREKGGGLGEWEVGRESAHYLTHYQPFLVTQSHTSGHFMLELRRPTDRAYTPPPPPPHQTLQTASPVDDL